MVYDAFRKNKGPTLYSENQTPFLADVVEGGLAFCAVILFVSFLLIVPGIRGKEKLYAVIRVTFLIFVGTVILVSLFAQSWEVGAISGTITQYKAGIREPVDSDVGLYIGLRGINVTLKSDTVNVTGLHAEKINYNEHYSWEWTQGRFGFGPFAGRFNREFRESQRRGTPYPILWVAEYFTIDGEGIRWGRFYRLAGWYSHIVLWLAFSFLIVAAIMTYVLIRYATYALALCGFCTTLANILFASIRNPIDLIIQFPGKQLTLAWGWTFTLNIIAGVLTLIVAIVLFVIDLRRPSLLVIFFGIDSLQDADEEVKMVEDKVIESDEGPSTVNGDIPDDSDNEADDDYAPVSEAPEKNVAPPKYVSRENHMTKKFKQNRRSAAPPPLRPRRQVQVHEQTVDDETEDYENLEAINKSGQQDFPMKKRQHRNQ